MSRVGLTTERVLAEAERVIQSNHEFRLNDSVHVNLIHVEMPNGGTGTKRSEINLEKHLVKKNSIIRIQNTDEICLCDVTLSVYPHRAGLKNMPGHGGIRCGYTLRVTSHKHLIHLSTLHQHSNNR